MSLRKHAYVIYKYFSIVKIFLENVMWKILIFFSILLKPLIVGTRYNRLGEAF